MGWNLVLVLRGGGVYSNYPTERKAIHLGKAEWKQTKSLIIGPAENCIKAALPTVVKYSGMKTRLRII
jgi:hypothetical protein